MFLVCIYEPAGGPWEACSIFAKSSKKVDTVDSNTFRNIEKTKSKAYFKTQFWASFIQPPFSNSKSELWQSVIWLKLYICLAD
jgi:hypothetical protein